VTNYPLAARTRCSVFTEHLGICYLPWWDVPVLSYPALTAYLYDVTVRLRDVPHHTRRPAGVKNVPSAGVPRAADCSVELHITPFDPSTAMAPVLSPHGPFVVISSHGHLPRSSLTHPQHPGEPPGHIIHVISGLRARVTVIQASADDKGR